MISEITVVELGPQPVLGMRRKGSYREIPVMFSRICEFAFSKNIPITPYPAFLCHEITVEEAQKADEEGNADIEVVFPISEFVEITGDDEIKVYELPGGKMAKMFIRALMRTAPSLMKNYFPGLQKTGK
ncbi:Bacterial transcription activator, effector binding protein [Methanosarcina horonobensis HB-1 = JCM 15518]|uniref:Bacterial transcription activator, effector binding protein n=1 Tax=Methanosarcina horonobensis HB-1 = JCM 15518 TaxID=1434110 RepID=A0A0E3SGF9_9EURY|nr:GyrI-like domain-containing protein [Methanosarcina horonobensis]AKB80201.1 Bacterial transcription activator, effector binding protein [Methanosarcina horonobensis HB-1 = JCM 15518]